MKPTSSTKAFNTLGAVLLGIGSMVGAGVFIVIGQAGAVTGNLVWFAFILGGLIALLSGYSLAKLALRYPSRGGISEYLVQSFGDTLFTGVASILFYFSQLVAIAAVAKSFGIYSATLMGLQSTALYSSLFAVLIVLFFMAIHLIGSSMIAKFENLIVGIKVTILVLFVSVSLFYIDPHRLAIASNLHLTSLTFAIGLTFFAYQGFSVITNTVEDMENPKQTMLKAMVIAIVSVMVLYVSISIVVFGNLSLDAITQAKDYALAEAAKPLFGEWGFKIIAVTALLATASAINATLYAATEISYTMAKRGELPKQYDFRIIHSYEGLIISTLLIIPMILFFDLTQITTIAALIVLLVQGITHIGHLRRIKQTQANPLWIALSVLFTLGIAGLMMVENFSKSPNILYYLLAMILIALLFEFILRFKHQRALKGQSNANA
ncbi:MAG: FIG01146408: hypothetical protein [uncultured Sulfurovum sp.]|uniref:Amino acid transporter n=1 Tax=uncultured Sulfurovum sp. TaxID=269237 RepID=A0A6S6U106_9BACT|nr:MAG: FIG01146408: hypothetical protein [uncultured Sulfurovum sp.]